MGFLDGLNCFGGRKNVKRSESPDVDLSRLPRGKETVQPEKDVDKKERLGSADSQRAVVQEVERMSSTSSSDGPTSPTREATLGVPQSDLNKNKRSSFTEQLDGELDKVAGISPQQTIPMAEVKSSPAVSPALTPTNRVSSLFPFLSKSTAKTPSPVPSPKAQSLKEADENVELDEHIPIEAEAPAAADHDEIISPVYAEQTSAVETTIPKPEDESTIKIVPTAPAVAEEDPIAKEDPMGPVLAVLRHDSLVTPLKHEESIAKDDSATLPKVEEAKAESDSTTPPKLEEAKAESDSATPPKVEETKAESDSATPRKVEETKAESYSTTPPKLVVSTTIEERSASLTSQSSNGTAPTASTIDTKKADALSPITDDEISPIEPTTPKDFPILHSTTENTSTKPARRQSVLARFLSKRESIKPVVAPAPKAKPAYQPAFAPKVSVTATITEENDLEEKELEAALEESKLTGRQWKNDADNDSLFCY